MEPAQPPTRSEAATRLHDARSISAQPPPPCSSPSPAAAASSSAPCAALSAAPVSWVAAPDEEYNSADEHDAAIPAISALELAKLESAFEARMARRGLRLKRMLQDGNCLFRAVSDRVYGDAEMHDVVRRLCMDYVSQARAPCVAKCSLQSTALSCPGSAWLSRQCLAFCWRCSLDRTRPEWPRPRQRPAAHKPSSLASSCACRACRSALGASARTRSNHLLHHLVPHPGPLRITLHHARCHA